MDEAHMTNIRIVVEEHEDGFVAYPLGLNGVVVGQGDTYETALADVSSAIHFHIETFGGGLRLPRETSRVGTCQGISRRPNSSAWLTR